ncbi:hypothetical protein ACWDE0_21950 [Streptomyces sp. 900105755]
MTDLNNTIPEICPHCDQPQPRGNIDEHIATAHANIPPCAATLDNQHTNGVLHCVLRAWHRKGHGEYGEWHVSARGPAGRTIWNDDADGATAHSVLDQPKEQ